MLFCVPAQSCVDHAQSMTTVVLQLKWHLPERYICHLHSWSLNKMLSKLQCDRIPEMTGRALWSCYSTNSLGFSFSLPKRWVSDEHRRTAPTPARRKDVQSVPGQRCVCGVCSVWPPGSLWRMCPQFEIVSHLQSSHPEKCEDFHVLNHDEPKWKDKSVRLTRNTSEEENN